MCYGMGCQYESWCLGGGVSWCPCCGLCSWAGAFLLDTKQYVCQCCVKWIEENEQWRKSGCAPNANTT